MSFMSPERVTGNMKPDDLEIGKMCDVWSIGILLYFLISGQMPFKGNSCKELQETIKKSSFQNFQYTGKQWINVPSDATNLIDQFLRKDPFDRIDAASAVNHMFF